MSTILASDPAHADGTPQGGNLPVPVHDGEVLRPTHASWLARAIRTLFGWRSDSLRANLQVVLETSAPGETSFSPVERTMLRNILYLRERRIADIMIPRADIVAVRQDISLGELMKLFESAGQHFNRGQRSFFFALGYLGWFVSPWVLFVTTAMVVIVTWRRQFASNAWKAMEK